MIRRYRDDLEHDHGRYRYDSRRRRIKKGEESLRRYRV